MLKAPETGPFLLKEEKYTVQLFSYIKAKQY